MFLHEPLSSCCSGKEIGLWKNTYRTHAIITRSWILTIHKARILQKISINENFWPSKCGFRIYNKSLVIMALVRYFHSVSKTFMTESKRMVNFMKIIGSFQNSEMVVEIVLSKISILFTNEARLYTTYQRNHQFLKVQNHFSAQSRISMY